MGLTNKWRESAAAATDESAWVFYDAKERSGQGGLQQQQRKPAPPAILKQSMDMGAMWGEEA